MKVNVRNRQAGFTLIEYIVGLVIAAIVASMVYSFFGTALTQSGLPILRLQKASNLSNVMENIVADFNRLNALNLRYKWLASIAYSLDSVVTPNAESKKNGHYYKCTAVSGTGMSGTTEPTWTTSGTQPNDGGITWTESGDLIVTVWKKLQLYTGGAIVVPINNTGHYYRCTTGGTSGATEPLTSAWLPTTVPSTPWQVTDGTVTWTEAGTVLDTTVTTDNLINYLTPNLARYGTGCTLVAAETKFIQFNGSTEVNAGGSGTSSEKNNLKVTIKNNDSAETLTAIFTIR